MYSRLVAHLESMNIRYQIYAMPNLELRHLTKTESAERNKRLLASQGVTSKLGTDRYGQIIKPRLLPKGAILFVDQPNLELGLEWHPYFASHRFKVAYSAYGFKVSPLDKWNFRQIVHKRGWAVFAESKWHLGRLQEHNPRSRSNFYLSGSPKIEAMRQALASGSKFAKPTLVWAPHWSIGSNSPLKYGTFDVVFPALVRLAKKNAEFNWILRPHQRLDSELRARGSKLSEYLSIWNSLDNCSTSSEALYQATLASAQGLITDSGSFLAEFSSLGKPLILLRRSDSVGYNSIGEEIISHQKRLEINLSTFNEADFEQELGQLLPTLNRNGPDISHLFPKVDTSAFMARIISQELHG